MSICSSAHTRPDWFLSTTMESFAGISAEIAKQAKLSMVVDKNQSGLVWAVELGHLVRDVDLLFRPHQARLVLVHDHGELLLLGDLGADAGDDVERLAQHLVIALLDFLLGLLCGLLQHR